MADDLVYRASLDDSEVLKALKRIDGNIERLADDASSQFERVGQNANLSGAQIGAIGGIVGALTTQFIELGQQAVQSLIQIGQQSVQIASGFDTLRARLLGIFDGSEQAADEAFNFIRDRSQELGIDLGELAGAFLPKVEDLQQFERVAKIATALARSDPEQGAIGARIALIEALSGTFTSLQRRFEIAGKDIDRLQEAFDTEGVEGFLSTLEQVLDESGKSFDDLSDTAQAAFAQVGQQGEEILGNLGGPVLDELKEQFQDLGEVLSENGDDFALIADTFGRVVAEVIDFVGSGLTDFLANIDTEKAIELGEAFFDLVNSARTFAEVLNLTELPQGLIDDTLFLVEKLNEAVTTATQIGALARATVARRQAEEQVRAEQGLTALGGLVSFAGTEEQQAEQVAAGQKAFNEVIKEAAGLLDESTKAQEENRRATDERAEAIRRAAEGDTDAADALLAEVQAAKEAAAAQKEYEEAIAKRTEETEKLERDNARARLDLIADTEDKAIDELIKAAQKREDIARKNAQKIADIRRDNEQRITDAATDLTRDEEDIARKRARALEDLEEESAQERADIERDFREELQSIQSQFNKSAQEARESRDAVAFIQAQQRRSEQIREAKAERDKAIEIAKEQGQERREELKKQQERELEDAQIANDRKLEDLQLRLERELEQQRIANERDLEQQSIAEDRITQELKREYDKRVEDQNKALERKRADLERSLAAELEIIKSFEEQKRQEFMQTQEVMTSQSQNDQTSLTPGLSAQAQNTVSQPGITNVPNNPAQLTPVTNNNATVQQNFGGPQDAVTRTIAQNAATSLLRRILS